MPNVTNLLAPAEVAQQVLDAIELYDAAFDMDTWFYTAGTGFLSPAETPSCGTTLCVAGWAAHLTGWTLIKAPGSRVYAVRGDRCALIPDAAREALGLPNDELFHLSSEDALFRLRRIAAG
jgi:hypothetical protein